MSRLKILFCGTPDFAAECLKKLYESGENIVGVIATPDKMKGRGMKYAPCEVKAYAESVGLDVYTPQTLKDGAISGLLSELSPDVIVVVAYGRILPKYVLDFPKYGCVNLHGSILPKYRGAAPIQRAVLDGEKETGVTTMLMDETLDTGDILLCEKTDIGENETSGELFDRLSKIGAELLYKTLSMLEEKSVVPQKQTETGSSYAEKITKEEAYVDFSAGAQAVHNKIRGMSPFPGAYTYLSGKMLKLYDSYVIDCDEETEAGRILCADREKIVFGCGKGKIAIRRFKPEGEGERTAADMINGRKLSVLMTVGK